MSNYDSEREALYRIWDEGEARMERIAQTDASGDHYMSTLTDYITAIDKKMEDENPLSKYHRRLVHHDVVVDVYDVLYAFTVDNPAIAHAIKKLLCTGTRGYKDFQQDLQEAIDSLERAKDFPPLPF